MRTYFDDLEKFESIVDEKVVKIFDFDGTLFNSPLPNPALWARDDVIKEFGGNIYGRLKGEYHRQGYGWYQNPLTLSDKYISGATFNEDVVKEVKTAMERSNEVPVLLTGRSQDYAEQIKKITRDKGLDFGDEYYFKPVTIKGREQERITTMDFKQSIVKMLLFKHNAKRIEMWDDRERHIPRLDGYLAKLSEDYPYLNLTYEVHKVRYPDYFMPEKDELELGRLLINSPDVIKKLKKESKVKNKKEQKPLYWAAVLSGKSKNELLMKLQQDIPNNWKIIAHHMTIEYGKVVPEMQEYLDNNKGKRVELKAIELGLSNDAMAVKIESDVPSKNKFKHVTIAVPPISGKPVNSNYITDWKKLSEPIILDATIAPQF